MEKSPICEVLARDRYPEKWRAGLRDRWQGPGELLDPDVLAEPFLPFVCLDLC